MKKPGSQLRQSEALQEVHPTEHLLQFAPLRKKGARQVRQFEPSEQLEHCPWTEEQSRQAPELRYWPTGQLRQVVLEEQEGQPHSRQEEPSRYLPRGQLRQEALEEQARQEEGQGWQAVPSRK